MKIGGLQETSLMDYPDKISAIIWTVGCNFRCPFCYNIDLVTGKAESKKEQEIFDFLEKRKGMLEALTITGGEPFLQKDLKEFVKKVKDMDYLIKIDTNGTFPDKLKDMLDEKLIDYVDMDVKAPKDKYNKLAGVKTDIKKIEETIDIIKNSNVKYEFKTTFIPDLLDKEDIIKIGKWLKGADKYFLQQFKSDTELVSEDYKNKLPYPKEYLEETLNEVKPFFKYCKIRGV